MSDRQNVWIGRSLLQDGNLKDNRPAWFVIAIAVFFVLSIVLG